jgi:hypothetical protein
MNASNLYIPHFSLNTPHSLFNIRYSIFVIPDSAFFIPHSSFLKSFRCIIPPVIAHGFNAALLAFISNLNDFCTANGTTFA